MRAAQSRQRRALAFSTQHAECNVPDARCGCCRTWLAPLPPTATVAWGLAAMVVSPCCGDGGPGWAGVVKEGVRRQGGKAEKGDGAMGGKRGGKEISWGGSAGGGSSRNGGGRGGEEMKRGRQKERSGRGRRREVDGDVAA
eukprot:363116-Chlamydomonas_euryale.AAC.9